MLLMLLEEFEAGFQQVLEFGVLCGRNHQPRQGAALFPAEAWTYFHGGDPPS